MLRCNTTLDVPSPFDLRLCLHGHGWVMLAPHRYDGDEGAFATVLAVTGQAIDVKVTAPDARRLRVTLTSHRRLPQQEVARVRQELRHMLRLDDDLSGFYAACRHAPRLHWAERRGAGRLLRSPTVFEDLMKLLFTTNTSWSGTEAMVANLVAARGAVAPSGARAFPTPGQCAGDDAFWRETVKVGYRARACRELAAAFASGALRDQDFLQPQPTTQLRERLLALHGFGPYAAGQAMRLLGHYDELALDSWCRARLAEMAGKRRPPSDRAVAKRYAPFAPFQGLALWLDLTADWHGEG